MSSIATPSRAEVLAELRADFWKLLEERAPEPPSTWIRNNCVITEGPRQGPVRFERGFRWQQEIVDELGAKQHPGTGTLEGCVLKCCQSGLTTLMLFLLIYRALVLRLPTLFLEPRDSDANRVASDADRLIMASDTLRDGFPGRDARKLRWTREGVKAFFRYSNSQDELVSISVQGLILDELDREYVGEDYSAPEMAAKRLDAWAEKLKVALSTPTYPGAGIDLLYESSRKSRWFVACPYCAEVQVPEFETNITWDRSQPTIKLQGKSAWMHCAVCKHRWSRFDRERADDAGFWRAEHPERSLRGWAINACHIVARDPCDLVEDNLKGEVSETARKEDLNQNKARTYLPKGAQVPRAILETAITDRIRWGVPPAGTVRLVCGIDVQRSVEPFDYVWEVRAYDGLGRCSLIAYGIASGRDAILGVLRRRWGERLIDRALMDASDGAHHSRVVRELATMQPGLSAAIFDHYMKAKTAFSAPAKDGSGARRVNRELVLTETMGRFHAGETQPSIQVARNPDWSAQATWMGHYGKLHRRERARRPDDDGVVYEWIKQEQMGVDYPFAGALCEAAAKLRAEAGQGEELGGSYGSLKPSERKERPHGTKPQQKGWGAIPMKGRGGRR